MRQIDAKEGEMWEARGEFDEDVTWAAAHVEDRAGGHAEAQKVINEGIVNAAEVCLGGGAGVAGGFEIGSHYFWFWDAGHEWEGIKGT